MTEAESYYLYTKIYTVVRQVPPGQVASYGDIAAIVGGGCDARTVGYALAALPDQDDDLPWQRIVSKSGSISTRGLRQRELLEAEGVAFDEQGCVVMARHHWPGPDPDWAVAHGFTPLPPRSADAEQLRLF